MSASDLTTAQEWSEESRALWGRLQSFQFNDESAFFDYTARLAKENDWNSAHAGCVVEEYRRFLFLAMQAGHPVTPSPAVDQAWHLHLVYTRSYWQELCRTVLGRPLHHEPTAGGMDEGHQFRDQYERTLASYRQYFDQEPPADIWPSVEACFAPKRECWVDVSRNWVLRKPQWLSHLTQERLIRVSLLFLSACALVSCHEWWNVLDYAGPEFLRFYGMGAIAALLLSSAMVWRFNRKPISGRELPALIDPYEIAQLGGGGGRVVEAALASLYAQGFIFVSGVYSFSRRDGLPVADLHPVEKKVLKAIPLKAAAHLKNIRKSMSATCAALEDKLVTGDYVHPKTRLWFARWNVCIPWLALMLFGAIKLIIGAQRERPVGFLIACLAVTCVPIFITRRKIRKRTVEGDATWRRMEMQRTVLNRDMSPNSPTNRDDLLVPMMVAMCGVSALSAAEYRPLHDALHRRGGAGSSGCGSSGCGTSSGCGDGGSSCGSSGCGGCGGGGD